MTDFDNLAQAAKAAGEKMLSDKARRAAEDAARLERIKREERNHLTDHVLPILREAQEALRNTGVTTLINLSWDGRDEPMWNEIVMLLPSEGARPLVAGLRLTVRRSVNMNKVIVARPNEDRSDIFDGHIRDAIAAGLKVILARYYELKARAPS